MQKQQKRGIKRRKQVSDEELEVIIWSCRETNGSPTLYEWTSRHAGTDTFISMSLAFLNEELFLRKSIRADRLATESYYEVLLCAAGVSQRRVQIYLFRRYRVINSFRRYSLAPMPNELRFPEGLGKSRQCLASCPSARCFAINAQSWPGARLPSEFIPDIQPSYRNAKGRSAFGA